MRRIIFTGLMVAASFIVHAQKTQKVVVKKTAASASSAKNVMKATPLPGNAIKKVSIKDVRAMMDTTAGPMIVNFWATWCGPCIREIPYFDSLIAVKGKPVKLVLVSLDFPESYPRQLAAFVKKQGYKGEVVFLNETNADYFCPIIDKQWNGAIPASVFINNDKNEKQFFGFQLTRERFALELDKLVD